MANSNRWISADISGDPATENPNAEYPRLSYGPNSNNYQQSTYWLRNGSYLRLKTVEVGYTLPTQLVNKVHFNTVRIFFCWHQFTHMVCIQIMGPGNGKYGWKEISAQQKFIFRNIR